MADQAADQHYFALLRLGRANNLPVDVTGDTQQQVQ